MMTCGSLYEVKFTPSNGIFENMPSYLKAQIARYIEEIVDKRVKEIVKNEVAREMEKYKEEIKKELLANKKEDKLIL